MIPILKPRLPSYDQLEPYIRKIDQSQWYSNRGPLCQELENRFSRRWDDQAYVTTVCNATLGLTITLQALGLKPGTGCLVPSWTFSATVLSIMNAGLKPIFVDVDLDTQLPLESDIRRLIETSDENISSLMVVYPFGEPIDYLSWEHLANELNIELVFDAAAAFDAWQVTNAPSVISLHATKILPAGEGGLIISKDKEFIDEVKARMNFGFCPGSRESMYQGTNAKLSEYHSAIALAALDSYPKKREQLQEVAQIYKLTTDELELGYPKGFGTSWLALSFSLVLPKTLDLSKTENFLKENGIQTRRWWGECHKMKVHQDHRAIDELTNTGYLYNQTLGLPFGTFLHEAEDLHKICRTLRKLFA